MRLREILETAATIVVAVVWFVALRPVALGGPASYLVVHGYSMSGTLAPGDLVVTMAQGSYSVGDAIVYHVPSGAGRGLLVVHRIIGADPSGYRMQGDANSYQDPWRPQNSDIVGQVVLTLPGLGQAMAWLANPPVLATAWGLAALALGLSFLPGSSAPPNPPLTDPKRQARRGPGRPSPLDATIALCVGVMVGLVGMSAMLVVYPACNLAALVLAPTGALSALVVGLFFLPASSIPRLHLLLIPKRPKLRGTGHSALDVAAAIAASLMVGLVIVSALAVISPAQAATLTLYNDRFTARVAHCSPAPPFPGTCS